MRELPLPRLLALALPGLAVLLLLGAGAGFELFGEFRRSLRVQARQQWEQRPFADYTLSVRVLHNGQLCSQDIDVVNGQAIELRDTCRVGWLGTLSIARIFTLSEQLEQAPECFPSQLNCACQIIRSGQVRYDQQLGLPQRLLLARSVLPNPSHLHFWRQTWRRGSWPGCGPNTQAIEIEVMKLQPRLP